jgi:hypothetical protein
VLKGDGVARVARDRGVLCAGFGIDAVDDACHARHTGDSEERQQHYFSFQDLLLDPSKSTGVA